MAILVFLLPAAHSPDQGKTIQILVQGETPAKKNCKGKTL